MSEIQFKSPVGVGPFASDDGSISLTDEAATTKILVRAARGTDAAEDLAVPYGRSRRRGDGTLVCGSRPDEWTLLATPGRSAEIKASVPSDGFVSLVDITHGRAMVRVSGTLAAAVLAKVCNIDLSDDMTPDGAVFSGSVAKVTCDLVRDDRDGEASYVISCERSFGAYLFAALADACTEFGVEVPSSLALH